MHNMAIDPYRMVFERLEQAKPASDAQREAVFDQCRAETAASSGDPQQTARELEELEKAIRRHRVQALHEAGPAPALPAHADEIYEAVQFECLRTGAFRRGTVGWRDGDDPWVSLQVHDGPSASAAGPSVQDAYDAAARAMAGQGYAALLGDAPFPFSDSSCHAKRFAEGQRWETRLKVGGAAAVLLIAGIAIGVMLG